MRRCQNVMSFSLPEDTLLEAGRLPVAEIARRTKKEGQRTRDIYRVHRWFARRLSTQFRSLLAAMSLSANQDGEFWNRYNRHIPLDDLVFLDPFVGGGTTVVEASRCGARVIGFDIDPVATFITRFELSARSRQADLDRARKQIGAVATAIRRFHRTRLPDGQDVEVLHHFWVEVTTCRYCERTFELHPHYQLAYDRRQQRQWVFCKDCHEIQEIALKRRRLDCACGTRTALEGGTLNRGIVRCPYCRNTWKLGVGNAEHPPVWRLFAQEVLLPDEGGFRRVFKRTGPEDDAVFAAARQELSRLEETTGIVAPRRLIPSAPRYDRRPLLHGIRRYTDLFNARQLLHLSMLGRCIMEVSEPAVKELLGLAFSEHLTTNCMYTAYAFGYRRTSPLFAIHGFRHIVRPVELNPWLDGIGRGTFPNALNKIERAIRYAQAPTDLDGAGDLPPEPIGPEDGRVVTIPAEVIRGNARAAVCTKSSAHLGELPDASVDVVLTDPPYLDNISYSELSDFYLAWHQVLGLAEGVYSDPFRSAPLAESLAPTERTGEALTTYTKTLTQIFRECHRVLHQKGLFVFTYHHKSPEAWIAVGTALARSGLRCRHVLPMRGEGQGGLHSKDGTIKWDAVLVCRKSSLPPDDVSVVVPHRVLEEAARCVSRYRQQLADPELGFRAPDQLNLMLACIAGRAIPGEPCDTRMSLSDAILRARQNFTAQS